MIPFSYNSAIRELQREVSCGSKVSLQKKWYGWIIIHEK